jgi:hypothetical protein
MRVVLPHQFHLARYILKNSQVPSVERYFSIGQKIVDIPSSVSLYCHFGALSVRGIDVYARLPALDSSSLPALCCVG